MQTDGPASASPNARLFLALWPDAAVRAELQRAQAAWRWAPGAALVPPERLHLTLHFIGEVARGRVPAVDEALAAVAVKPVELLLDTPDRWQGGLAVLCAGMVDEPLARLQQALRAAVEQALDAPGERRRFKPHVTLARRAGGSVPPGAPLAVGWRTARCALVESLRGAAGAYHLLRVYGAG